MRAVRIVPPAVLPVLTAVAVRHCRMIPGDDDDTIEDLIERATSHLDGPQGLLNRCLITQTWRVGLDRFASSVRLPFCDVQSVSVSYYDPAGDRRDVDPGAYELASGPRGRVIRFRGDWSAPIVDDFRSEPIEVDMICGFGDAPADVPGAIRQAILQIVGLWYDNRNAAGETSLTEIPIGVSDLVARWRHLVI